MSHEKVYKNKDFCGLVMPSKKKSDKLPYIFYADIESLIRKQENKHTLYPGKDCMKKFSKL